MYISWPVPVLLTAGIIPLIFVPELKVLGLIILLVALLIAVDILAAPTLKKLSIQRVTPTAVRLGESTKTELFITNPSKRCKIRLLVRDAWQPSAGAKNNRTKLVIPPGERRRIRTELVPQRRGWRQAAQITVRASGPFRLAGRQLSYDCDGQILVLPAFPSKKHLPGKLAKLQQIDGKAVARSRGQGTEFDSLRDYVDGDDVRSIDWRATARRDHLVVRTWRPERDRRILIVLDSSRISAGRVDDIPRIDAAMDAALLLGAVSSRAGDQVGLVVGDREIRKEVPMTRARVLPQLSKALAEIDPHLVEADWMVLSNAIASRNARPSLLVLLTQLDPAALGETLLPILPTLVKRHRVIIASVADPQLDRLVDSRQTPKSTYLAAAAKYTKVLHQKTADTLSHLGVTVIEESPQDLAVVLADKYLELKYRGLL